MIKSILLLVLAFSALASALPADTVGTEHRTVDEMRKDVTVMSNAPQCYIQSSNKWEHFTYSVRGGEEAFTTVASCGPMTNLFDLQYSATGGGIVHARDIHRDFKEPEWFPIESQPVIAGGNFLNTESWKCTVGIPDGTPALSEPGGLEALRREFRCFATCCQFGAKPGTLSNTANSGGRFLVDLPRLMSDSNTGTAVEVRIRSNGIDPAVFPHLVYTGKQFCDIIGAGGDDEMQVAAFFSDIIGFFNVADSGALYTFPSAVPHGSLAIGLDDETLVTQALCEPKT